MRNATTARIPLRKLDRRFAARFTAMTPSESGKQAISTAFGVYKNSGKCLMLAAF